MKYKTPISVIMPCYNCESYVAESIQSILNQTHKAFELIIINDGASDNTELEILKFDDPRIVYLKNEENSGVCTSRNRAMLIAKGKYICMIDSDDIALPHRLEIQYAYLESHLHIGCIGSLYDIIDESGKKCFTMTRPLSNTYVKTWLFKDCFVQQSTIMIRTYLVLKHKLFYIDDYKPAEDYDFLARASHFFSIRNLEDVLVQYRSHSNQLSFTHRAQQIATADEIRKNQLQLFNLVPTETEINLHLKLMKDDCLTNSELKLCEDWCNKLLERNYELKLFNNKTLYELLDNSLRKAIKNNLSMPSQFNNKKEVIKKIAFCFLIYDVINHESLWELFFRNIDRNKYNIYIHYKTNTPLNHFEKYKLKDCIKTKYCDVSIIHAHNLLFNVNNV